MSVSPAPKTSRLTKTEPLPPFRFIIMSNKSLAIRAQCIKGLEEICYTDLRLDAALSTQPMVEVTEGEKMISRFGDNFEPEKVSGGQFLVVFTPNVAPEKRTEGKPILTREEKHAAAAVMVKAKGDRKPLLCPLSSHASSICAINPITPSLRSVLSRHGKHDVAGFLQRARNAASLFVEHNNLGQFLDTLHGEVLGRQGSFC